MKKVIVGMAVFAVSVALLCVGTGCDGNGRSVDWEGNVDGFLGRINEMPGGGTGGGTDIRQVTVVSIGSGATSSGNYVVGQTVFINAGTKPKTWMFFDRWTTLSKGVAFSDSANASTSFIMPANDVTVTAVFDTTEFKVIVDAGVGATGSGKYKVGRTVNIAVGAIPSGYDKFLTWTDNVTNVTTSFTIPATSFTMPAYAVTATAAFGETGGKTYRTVEIGGKRWMAENLNYKTSSGSLCYEFDDSNCDKYGRLYNWYTAMVVCPTGWHLSTREEWGELAIAAGGTGTYGTDGTAGKKLKSTGGWTGWGCFPPGNTCNGNGTDEFAFSALPGGFRNTYSGFYNDAGAIGYWWASTKISGGGTYYRSMNNNNDYVHESEGISNAYSVRCVAD